MLKYFISKNYFSKFPVDNRNLCSNSIPDYKYNGPSRFTTANTLTLPTFLPDSEDKKNDLILNSTPENRL